MKKLATMAISIGLIGTMVAGGSLAYLSSTDSDVNVMTLGNVKVVQNEQQRVDNGTEFTSELEAFEQGKVLMPVTYPGNRTADTVTIGDYTITLSDDEANYVDKIISVTNTGSADAYVRTLVAVPTGGADWETNGPVAASDCWLHWNIPAGYGDHWTLKSTNVPMVGIDGENYYIWEFVHTAAVKSDETTFPMVRGFYMDKRVNNDDKGFFMDLNSNGKYDEGTDKRIADISADDTVNVIAITQAVQAAGFADAQTALDEAFGDVNTENATSWFGAMQAPVLVETAEDLTAALEAGDSYIILGADINLAAEEDATAASLEIAEDKTVTLDLNGYTLTNAVAGAPALVNNGTLTIDGTGAIVNGVNSTKASHTIVNNGTLTIEDGNIGTDDTAGAAVVNYGTTTINGGTFASKQENSKGDGLCAYAFINQAGTMTINNATLNGRTHGLFGAYDGEVIVNGGEYTMDGNGGLGCYVVYATGEGKVTLNDGTINTNEPRSNRVFFVYDNGNYFNADAVETGKVVVNDAAIYLNGVLQTY